MSYENAKADRAGSVLGLQQANDACEKPNTIEDQMRNLNILVQRIEQTKANVRGISDQICGVSGMPPESDSGNPKVTPGHVLYRLTDAIRNGMESMNSIDRELTHIRAALNNDA